MIKFLALGVVCLGLSGCAVATAAADVAGAGVSVASTVVSTTADVAGGAVSTVAGKSKKDDH